MKLRSLLLSASLVVTALPLVSAASADEKNEGHEQNEKRVSLDSIPAPARDALKREAGGATILGVEQETENGKTVYEGTIKEGNDTVGISVDANGNLVSRHSESKEHE